MKQKVLVFTKSMLNDKKTLYATVGFKSCHFIS